MPSQAPRNIALRAALIYLIVAGLWIVLSDLLVMNLAEDLSHAGQLQTWKGWGFVAVTGALIFLIRLRAEQRHASAQQQLRESEQRFRNAIQAMPVLFDAFDERGEIIFWNQECERVTGYPAEEIVSNPQAMELLYPDAAYRQAMLAEMTERGNNYRHWECTLTRKEGGERVVAWSNISDAMPIPGWAGWGIGVDVTERVQAERALQRANRALRVLSEVNQILVRTEDEQELLQAACQAIVQLGGYRLAWVGYAEDDEAKTVRPVAQAGYEEGYLDSLQLTWADEERGRGPTGTAIRSGKPSLARNFQDDSLIAPWRDQALARGYQSSIALPLFQEARCLGALNIYASETDAFDEEEVRLLSELAADLGYGISAARARAGRDEALAALRQREALLESVLRVAPIGIGMVVDRVFHFVNARFCQLLGYEPEEFIGQNARMVYPDEETYQEVAVKKYPAVRQGQIGSIETIMRRKDGRLVDVLLQSAAIDPSDLAAGVIFTVTDISGLKDAERAQKLYAERLRILRAIDQAILSAHGEEEIMAAALSRILDLLPGAGAGMIRLDSEKQTVELANLQLREALDFSFGMRMPLQAQESVLALLQQGRSFIENDLALQEDLPALPRQLLDSGVRSFLAVPILSDGELFGALIFVSLEPAIYRAEHVELAREVADQMAIALHQLKLHEQIERYAHELEQRVAERTADLQRLVNLMAGRELRMAELKQIIARLRAQLLKAGLQPVDDSPGLAKDRIPGTEAMP